MLFAFYLDIQKSYKCTFIGYGDGKLKVIVSVKGEGAKTGLSGGVKGSDVDRRLRGKDTDKPTRREHSPKWRAQEVNN